MASSSKSMRGVEDLCAAIVLEEEEEGGIVVEDLPAEGALKWCLVGRFLTDRPVNFIAMKNTLASIWRPEKGVYIKDLSPSVFLFQFFDELDVDRVVRGGPWTFDQHMLITSRLEVGLSPLNVPLFFAEFWIQVHDLPCGFMSERVGKEVGNFIGTFLEVDANSFDGFWRSYMRIRVAFDVRKPLKRRMKLKKAGGDWSWINFKYECLPTFCFYCGLIGHSDRFCEKLLDCEETPIVKPYGIWLEATSQRGERKRGSQRGVNQIRESKRWLRNPASASSLSDVAPGTREEIDQRLAKNQEKMKEDSVETAFLGGHKGNIKGDHIFLHHLRDSNDLTFGSDGVAGNTDLHGVIILDSKRHRTAEIVTEPCTLVDGLETGQDDHGMQEAVLGRYEAVLGRYVLRDTAAHEDRTVTAVDDEETKPQRETVEVFIDRIIKEKPIRFSSKELAVLTSNYCTKLGSGGFGAVYKGKFPNGAKLAVKVLKTSNIDKRVDEQFMAEVGTLGRTHHRNLVRLYGFCFDANTKALVYEYMENGSLDMTLFGKKHELDWANLWDIAIGVAKGLEYLHHYAHKRIIHYDIKPGNVLLDSEFCPKLADFGLAKLCNRESTHVTLSGFRGTPGYAAPELWMPYPVTYKCDVYSFGMMLFEIVGRKRNLDINLSDSQEWFPRQLWDKYNKGELEMVLADGGIEVKDMFKAKTMAMVALWCVHYLPKARPSMSNVIKILEGEAQAPNPPNPFQHLITKDHKIPSFTESNSSWGTYDGTMGEEKHHTPNLVMEKRADIVHSLHLGIHEAFGNADCDMPAKVSLSNHKQLGSAGLALHHANIIKLNSNVAPYTVGDNVGDKALREPFSFQETNAAPNSVSLDDINDGIPRLSRAFSRKSRSTQSKQVAVAKVSEASSLLGRVGTAGLGKAVEVLDKLGSSMTNLSIHGGFTYKLAKGSKISMLAFEVANTIVKGANLMQSLSKENIKHLKEVVLLSEGVQNLISREIDELLGIAASDKREELKVFSGEVARFGNLCIDLRWHNLDRYAKKLGSELTLQKRLKDEAARVMQQLMTLVQHTAELYHELHALDRLEQDYIYWLKAQEEDNSNSAKKGDSLAILRAEIKSQRKYVRSLKKKSLWSKIFEEIMEKLVDIVHSLHLGIHEAFGNSDCDMPAKVSSSNHKKLGSAGLALHYANIISQIDTLVSLVSRSNSVPPNTRDALYQGLPPNIKLVLRSKLRSFQHKEELTVAQIKAEMERTLQWLVPIAANTTKVHHWFGWVGDWANTGSEVNRKPVNQADLLRIETLHHADKEKTEPYILELIVWLHHLVSQARAGNGGIRSPVQSPNQKLFHLSKPSCSSPILTIEDQEILLDVSRWKKTPGISKSLDFDTAKNRLSKHHRLSKSSNHSPTSEGRKGTFPIRRPSSVPVFDFDMDSIKALDVIDRVDTIRSL